ncbi:MAG: Uma2 family endonuclease [Proteobacteria bacterium]|nr:Uma2 family endonuclease [Pseudomonadota bacterium]
MGTALRKPSRVSEQEYMEFENGSPLRHELVGGVIYGMVGGSDRHNLICTNLVAALHSALSSPRQVFSAQMKLRVEAADETDFYYPDVFVSCDPSDRAKLFRERPRLIVEVLSDSTERDDRRGKFSAYRQIPSLMEYVIVAQDVPQIEVMRRRASWKPEFLFLEDTLKLESVVLEIPLQKIYRDIPF